jgi:hypothetical protein
MKLSLHLKGAERPVSRIQLIASDSELVDGSAARYYLKAPGLLE